MMLVEQARAITKADAAGELRQARTETGEATHLALRADRYSLCGKRVVRSGGGGSDCRTCTRMLAKAKAVYG
jgi:hypothetical protein